MASTSSIAPWSAKEQVLMLYFNTNMGATHGWLKSWSFTTQSRSVAPLL